MHLGFLGEPPRAERQGTASVLLPAAPAEQRPSLGTAALPRGPHRNLGLGPGQHGEQASSRHKEDQESGPNQGKAGGMVKGEARIS